MHEYRDLSRLTRTATAVVAVYLLFDLVMSATALVEGPVAADVVRISDIIALVTLIIFIGCVVVVGRWIYRASANAHSLSEQLTISPGWAVGWYFIPIMNLFRPFQAMKEIWFASHDTTASFEERAPSILSWWWGLWIVNNVLGNISFRLSMNAGDTSMADTINMISAVVNVPLCLALIAIMRAVASSQEDTFHAAAFA